MYKDVLELDIRSDFQSDDSDCTSIYSTVSRY